MFLLSNFYLYFIVIVWIQHALLLYRINDFFGFFWTGRALASTRRGCRGHIPPNILVGGTSTGISPPILLRTFRYSRPILVASSRFHSAIRRHQFASVRQADSQLTRLVPPTLNSRWRHCGRVSCKSTELKRCSMIEMRWNCYYYWCLSSSMMYWRRPNTRHSVAELLCTVRRHESARPGAVCCHSPPDPALHTHTDTLTLLYVTHTRTHARTHARTHTHTHARRLL